MGIPSERSRHIWKFRDRALQLGHRTRVMGILNVTPDSFYSGSRHSNLESAVETAQQMIDQGVDIIDVGGESSRPGAESVSPEVELERVVPLIREIRRNSDVVVSVDTVRSEVASQALEEGADIINDVSALGADPRMGEVASRFGAGIILMHMRGQPRNMQQIPPSPDILKELRKDLQQAVESAELAGIHHDRIVLDPGIGFGKTVDDNLRIVNRLSVLADFNLPILLGTSRKSFLGHILGVPTEERLWGTAASVAVSIIRGAHVVRVHDVAEMRMVVKVTDALLNEER